MTLSFSLSCNPPRVTKQMKKTICRKMKGKWVPVPVDTPELKEATQLYMELLLPHRPVAPLDGPLLITLIWHFEHNQSAQASVKDQLVWMDTAPDLDNMEKLILDTMAKMGFLANDSRVSLKITGKVFNPKWQGIAGSIQELPKVVSESSWLTTFEPLTLPLCGRCDKPAAVVLGNISQPGQSFRTESKAI